MNFPYVPWLENTIQGAFKIMEQLLEKIHKKQKYIMLYT